MKSLTYFLAFIICFNINANYSFAQLELVDLNFTTLKQEFNLVKDKPLLLTILGVNCPPCRTHRDDIKNQIINQCDNPDLRWFIIWFEDPGHPALRSDAVSQANLINDSRVTQWWYKEHQSNTPKNDSVCYKFGDASWMNCNYPWDITMLFDAGIEWTATDPPNSTFCMSKTGCCNSFSMTNLVSQVDNINACDDATPTSVFNNANNSVDITIFPNPVSNELNLVLLESNEPIEIVIFNSNGKVVYSDTHVETQLKTLPIKVQEWENGLYLIQMKVNDRLYSQRFMKSQ